MEIKVWTGLDHSGLALETDVFSRCPCPDLLFNKDTDYIGSEPTQMTSFFLNHLFKGLVFTYSHIQRHWGFGLGSEFSGDTSQPVTQCKRQGGLESMTRRGGRWNTPKGLARISRRVTQFISSPVSPRPKRESAARPPTRKSNC